MDHCVCICRIILWSVSEIYCESRETWATFRGSFNCRFSSCWQHNDCLLQLRLCLNMICSFKMSYSQQWKRSCALWIPLPQPESSDAAVIKLIFTSFRTWNTLLHCHIYVLEWRVAVLNCFRQDAKFWTQVHAKDHVVGEFTIIFIAS